ncbi:MAG: hypothetical protein GXO40_00050 [Epsilonproteobacteria bacterium]|nr:hypothetical protein [Campylobacterota bacterium]
MQNKRNLLKKSFVMVFAILTIVVLGTIAMWSMYISSTSQEEAASKYLQLQANLYAKSATEFAIEALQSRDFQHDGCIRRINLTNLPGSFQATVTFFYFLDDCNVVGCNANNCATIQTPESNGTVLVNTAVTNTQYHIRYFRQTLQKP